MMHRTHSEGGFMRKPDDDLKIDISELFGGEMPGPSETLEDTVPLKAVPDPQASLPVASSSTESENQFQDWMKTRNEELELKAQELERRLQELQQTQQAPATSPDSLSGTDLQTAIEVEKTQNAPPGDLQIDFSAPIAPPFMGAGVPTEKTAAPPAVEGLEAPEVVDPQKAEELKKL